MTLQTSNDYTFFWNVLFNLTVEGAHNIVQSHNSVMRDLHSDSMWGIFSIILSLPHNIVMGLNNVMMSKANGLKFRHAGIHQNTQASLNYSSFRFLRRCSIPSSLAPKCILHR